MIRPLKVAYFAALALAINELMTVLEIVMAGDGFSNVVTRIQRRPI